MADSRISEELRRKRNAAAGEPAGGHDAAGATVRRKKKSRKGPVIAIIGLLVLALIVVMVVMGGKKTEGTPVETEKVMARTIVQTVTATGVVDPETQVKISPEVSGEIIFLGAKEGESVKKGQVLVRINPESFAAQVQQAEAGIAASKARQAQSRASLLRNQQDLARLSQLHEKKLATDQDLEAAQAQVNISQAEVDAAKFQVDEAQASYRQIRESLGKTTITSPISGVVTKLNSKLGEKVVGAIQMTGTEIMTVADLSVIESVVDVSETDVVQVSMGDTAEVEVDALPNQKFLAVVSRIANSPKQSGVGTQEQLTNFEVRLRFISPDERFRPGMTVVSTVRTDSRPNVVAVPIQSVTTREEDSTAADDEAEQPEGVTNTALVRAQRDERPKPIVFVQEGTVVHARQVETGIRDDQYIEIKSGLKAGDIVVSGPYKAITKDLKNGEQVTKLERDKNSGKE